MQDRVTDYFHGAGSGLLARLFNYAGGFFCIFLLTRIIGPGGYGTYVLAMTLIHFIALLSRAGMDKSILYRVPRLEASDSGDEGRHYVSAATGIVVIISTVVAPVIWFLASLISGIFSNLELVFWMRALSVLLPVLNVQELIAQWLIATERVPERYLFNAIIPRSLFTVSLLVIYFFLSHSLLLVFSGLLLAHLVPVLVWGVKERIISSFSIRYIADLDFAYGLQMLGNAFLDRFLWRIDILFVSFFLGEMATGGYNIAVKLAKVGFFMDDLTTPVLRPKLGKWLKTNRIQDLKREYDELRTLSLGFLVCYGFGLAFAAPFLFSLFGPYTSYVLPSLILVSGYGVVIGFGNIGNVLLMEGEASWLLFASFVSLLFNCLANYLLIPALGVSGAAMATAGALILLNTISFFVVRWHLEIDLSSWKEQVLILILFGGLLGSGFLSKDWPRFLGLTLFGAVCLSLFGMKFAVFRRNFDRLKTVLTQEYDTRSNS